ncbi:MAG: SulP family inorganic anion transporter [Candidatus Pedobacter colombiensis]|uniref:SulP family inorganic anion transporter n=1 Tax=Candidatus Pedobacter colombiensis TaxID=3121371 RepID=A0AAJ5W8I1_9SPHI|nr:SulP family inorganic anion transporter [Pedobacter sp.]WEK19884.1 MAG: SulP family inorganic anion transporter [Pedobacter sp.]
MQSGNSIFSRLDVKKYILKKNLKRDLPSSIVVFLVALPLCLGIALASGAPLFAGLITGIVGGIVVASLSGSQLSVSGPAAGLTAIVLGAIGQLGNYQTFLLAVVLAGLMQLILGLLKGGMIGNYFPSSVIEGMLAAIGLTLILKQLPHALGVDSDFFGDESFFQKNSENTFSAISGALDHFTLAAIVISGLSILVLIFWPKFKKLSTIPAPLVVVILGIGLSLAFQGTGYALQAKQMVEIPVVNGWAEFKDLFIAPNFSEILNGKVWVVAATIAVVASLETLLSIEAVDKIDPLKRVSPTNRELMAQGAGNMFSGLLGGLPLTSVIVRSSANVNSGGKTKMSAIFHGIWLLLSLLFIPGLINMIPLACLAAILLVTGYKLTRVALFKHMFHKGWDQFVPFVITIVAVLLTDLLKGVAIGMLFSVFYLLRTNMRNPYFYKIQEEGNKKNIRIKLAEEVSFLNKAAIQVVLNKIPKETNVVIDGTNSRYIDPDVLEAIFNYKHNAYTKGIIVMLENVKEQYTVPKLNNKIIEEINN